MTSAEPLMSEPAPGVRAQDQSANRRLTPGDVGAEVARRGLAVWVIVLLAVVGLSIADGGRFWTSGNLANILTAMVVLGLVALGQHLVVLSGGIDLSVGSLATLTCLLSAVWIDAYPVRTVPVIVAVLVIGAAAGALHGLLVHRGLAPFVVTLATFYLFQGIAFLISTSPTGQVTSQLSSLGLNQTGPFPWSFAVLAVAVAIVAIVLSRTVYGRHLFAVGGDPTAARSNGIAVGRVLIVTYAASGLLAAAAGVMLAARATVGSPTAGQGLELSAITVVVVGGTSLLGGRGRLVGTIGGVVLLALVETSVTLLQLPSTLTDLIRGVVILLAAAVFLTRERR